ncbi:MAG: hypothetical protein N2484_17465 [Clostridia bacterium]|nr:hypothetical protein [Clostridia bacterium]
MALLMKYEDFLDRVNELGYMAFSNMLPGFPSLEEETPKEIWHTGDPDTDPWRWKDRAAEEKKLAFGCILGGHKGFVAARMYSEFYAACHMKESLEEKWVSGRVKQTTWQLWKLFEEKTLLDTGDIRREMGVTPKKGGNRVDTAIKELQQYYCITVAGSRRKTDKYGRPYGWPINIYDKVENWAPAEWMKGVSELQPEEAKVRILEVGLAIGKNIDRNELAKKLGI